MTEEEFWKIINKANSGDLDAMKRAAFILMEISEKKMAAGEVENAMNILSRVDEYRKKIKAIDPNW